MTNKAATHKKTRIWCDSCKATSTVRHPRDKKVLWCPICARLATVESIQSVMPK